MSVSVAEDGGVDDTIHRTMFEPSTQNPCAAVIEAIEAATGVRKIPVLADSIDPDTLTQLYRGDSASWMLSFEHAGLEITIWGTGRIHVDTGGLVESTESEISGRSTSSTTAPTTQR